tara:strand:- start:913 stop:1500 length:588 start_codon:yes stop_codon:yes gene_type:complete
MQAFSLQIDNIVGYDVGASTDVDDALTASAKEVLDILPDAMLLKHASTSATSSNVLDVENKRILRVTSGGYIAKEVPLGLSTQVSDSNSIHYATARTPAYYIKSNKNLEIKPSDGNVDHITYPPVTHDLTAINQFPDTAEHAVVLSASIKLLNKKLGALIVTDEDTELAQTIQGLIASTSALYQKEIQRLTGAKS